MVLGTVVVEWSWMVLGGLWWVVVGCGGRVVVGGEELIVGCLEVRGWDGVSVCFVHEWAARSSIHLVRLTRVVATNFRFSSLVRIFFCPIVQEPYMAQVTSFITW